MSPEEAGRSDCSVTLSCLKGHREWERSLGLEKSKCHSIFQNGKKENLRNYRRVSLASVPEKEKVIRSSLQGSTKGKSCFNNLVALCDVVTCWEDEQTAMAVAYSDFSKVLDTILHNR